MIIRILTILISLLKYLPQAIKLLKELVAALKPAKKEAPKEEVLTSQTVITKPLHVEPPLQVVPLEPQKPITEGMDLDPTNVPDYLKKYL